MEPSKLPPSKCFECEAEILPGEFVRYYYKTVLVC